VVQRQKEKIKDVSIKMVKLILCLPITEASSIFFHDNLQRLLKSLHIVSKLLQISLIKPYYG